MGSNYPYDEYQRTTNPQSPENWQLLYSVGRAGVGLGVTALEALDYVKNGRPVPIVTWQLNLGR